MPREAFGEAERAAADDAASSSTQPARPPNRTYGAGTLVASKGYGIAERTQTLLDVSRSKLNGPTPHQVSTERAAQRVEGRARARLRPAARHALEPARRNKTRAWHRRRLRLRQCFVGCSWAAACARRSVGARAGRRAPSGTRLLCRLACACSVRGRRARSLQRGKCSDAVELGTVVLRALRTRMCCRAALSSAVLPLAVAGGTGLRRLSCYTGALRALGRCAANRAQAPRRIPARLAMRSRGREAQAAASGWNPLSPPFPNAPPPPPKNIADLY
eukprot:366441-Chlamydomonas_euryale.AAC.3